MRLLGTLWLVFGLVAVGCYKHVESASDVHSVTKDAEEWTAAGQETVSANEETSVIQKPTEIDVHKVVNEFETPAATTSNPNPKRQLRRQTVIDVSKKLGEVDKTAKANTQATAAQEATEKKQVDAKVDGEDKTVTISRTGPPGWVYFAVAALVIAVAIVGGFILAKSPPPWLKVALDFLKRL